MQSGNVTSCFKQRIAKYLVSIYRLRLLGATVQLGMWLIKEEMQRELNEVVRIKDGAESKQHWAVTVTALDTCQP